MELTIKKTKTIESNVTIKLPYYSKSVCHFFKIVSKEKCIQVTSGEHVNPAICIAHAGLAIDYGQHPSNESEFNEAFQLVMDQLNMMKNETI